MTISTKKPLYAEVNNVPDDYEFTNEELNRIIAGDMFTPRQDAIMAREIQKLRAAMLNGDEPVSQTYGLPQTQFEQVADLYALCWQSGEVVTYTPDPEKATIWINNYSGTCVQEYVKLERLQEALAGNSPVIPDGYALVPVEPTDEMIAAAMNCEDVLFNSDESFCVQFGNIYEAMLAAAPQEVK
ncbi:TPA: DUF551 domain-containing protein [Salmonella enterica subsp. enterica serovar Kentucky]|uniref:DUF551 domain-containing protein n=1 Tax=Salmonella enterica TaxID=28901 RepID=UPI001388CF25|nr:DUF551 domain-containing protein [Salmonella enterica]EDN5324528.1 DUF551 domain-containing protein [Salmonella enterica]MCJ9798628.1 DUF551 domain-containing protein [Salmonella enterica subsp. enterica serovar Kentucky]